MTEEDAVPRPQAISGLLGRCGFVRSETHRRGRQPGVVYTAGYHVSACVSQEGVTVRFWPEPDAGSNLADNRAMLARYAEVITAAGYDADLRRHEVIVTCRRAEQGGECEEVTRA